MQKDNIYPKKNNIIIVYQGFLCRDIPALSRACAYSPFVFSILCELLIKNHKVKTKAAFPLESIWLHKLSWKGHLSLSNLYLTRLWDINRSYVKKLTLLDLKNRYFLGMTYFSCKVCESHPYEDTFERDQNLLDIAVDCSRDLEREVYFMVSNLHEWIRWNADSSIFQSIVFYQRLPYHLYSDHSSSLEWEGLQIVCCLNLV